MIWTAAAPGRLALDESISIDAQNAAQPLQVDVCICTYCRPSIVEALASVAAQTLPTNVRVRVIVADNDEQPDASDMVQQAGARLGLDLTYVHAPARNISRARNACLDAATGDWLAFIDDDETAEPGWLAALLDQVRGGEWDAVLGPVSARYGPETPEWIRNIDLHSTRPVWVRSKIETGYTSNALVSRHLVAANGLRFDEKYGRSGGEDADFFYRLGDAGARIGFAEDAVVSEPVPHDRARLGWLLRRSFRSGQTHGSRLLAVRSGRRVLDGSFALLKTTYCILMAMVHVLDPGKRNRNWVRGALHLGVACRLAGLSEIALY